METKNCLKSIKYTIEDILLFGDMMDIALKPLRDSLAKFMNDVTPYYCSVKDELEELYEHKLDINHEFIEEPFMHYLYMFNASWTLLIPYSDIPLYVTNLDKDTYQYTVLKWRLQIGK